ncbi:MAG: GTPase Era [Gammaproteobacteria bacterium]
MPETELHCGFVALAGRPNVGKSTLVNALVGAPVSIVSTKPQTTRRRILGIRTTPAWQIVLVDTPGLRSEAGHALERHMNRTAMQAAADADAVLMVVEAGRWSAADDYVLERCLRLGRPLALAVNKIDTLHSRDELLPFLEAAQARAPFRCLVPVAARSGENLARLETELAAMLPVSAKLFPDGQVSDQTQTVQAAECIREKLLSVLEQELPYCIAVGVEEFALRDEVLHIQAVIWVEREGQKAIVIGRAGSLLKRIGREARLELEQRWRRKIFLRLWVKVRKRWTDDDQALHSLGLDPP